jgi:hypothetical protein
MPGCLGAWVPGGEGTVRFLPINIRRRASSAKQSKEVPNHSLGPEQSKQTPSPTADTTADADTDTQGQTEQGRAGQGRAGQSMAGQSRAGQRRTAQRSAARLSTAQHSTGADNNCSKPRRAPRPSPLVVVES